MRPYYQDDSCTIYHGDCDEILTAGMVGVIVTDPPYGTGEKRNYLSRKRGALATCNDYPDIKGDFAPFDPAFILSFGVPTILWGANHYAERLPSESRWLVWDKLDGLKSGREVGFNDQADVELAWTNLGGPARLHSQRWMGAMKSGENAAKRRQHPTEKPVELMRWAIIQTPDGIVVDPYMGSGTTLRAAKDLGRKAIGIEIEERYCEIAVERLRQEVFDFGSNATIRG